MRSLKMTLAYDGTNYVGWQIQPNGRSLQETIEKALVKITGETVRAIASGRTDAGVHALAQVVSLQIESELAADVLCRALNANTPEDISVLSVEEAPAGFHAIRDSTGKRYRYVITNEELPNIFQRFYAWYIPQQLDIEGMHLAAQTLLGKHDFASFEAAGSERATSVRTISDIFVRYKEANHIKERDRENIVIEIEADGFLYNMVRNIVGSLVDVGRGRQTVDWMAEVLSAKDRKAAGATAPPHGLFLVQVEYHP